MFGTQEKTAYKNIDSAKRKKIKMYLIVVPTNSYFRLWRLLADVAKYFPFKNTIFRGHDFKDFAQNFDRLENIAPRVCMVSLTHTGGLLDIRKSHLRAGGGF